MNEADVTIKFGRALRRLRRERGWSQAELAKKAQLVRTYVSGVETGDRNPTLHTVSRLAEALDVSLVDLFRLADGSL